MITQKGLGFLFINFMKNKIKFQLNKKLDKEMAMSFLYSKQGGIKFSRNVINIHPELRGILKLKSVLSKKTLINKHFDYFYKKHNGYLNKKILQFTKEWRVVEKNFFDETDKIFKNYPWPKGKYIGYLSIIDCNPRFLNNKTFQVFYFNSLGVRYVTTHEMLHFIFYDYTSKKYQQIFKKLDPNSGVYWDLAELFNAVILHTPPFIKIHNVKKIINYPNHKKYLPAMIRLWKKYKDVDEWIERALAIIK